MLRIGKFVYESCKQSEHLRVGTIIGKFLREEVFNIVLREDHVMAEIVSDG